MANTNTTNTLYFRVYRDETDADGAPRQIPFHADSDDAAVERCQGVYLPQGERLTLMCGVDRTVARFKGDKDGNPLMTHRKHLSGETGPRGLASRFRV